ncbi:MAG: hypothetical protein ACOYN2_06170 [Patescibacteria group bacterium]
MTEEDLTDYREYREKIIDREVLFEPLPEECMDIVFGSDDKTDETITMLIEWASKLNISNIRILKKIRRLGIMLIPHLTQYEKALAIQAFSTLCLLSLAYYSR